jgi:hypothetical protein
MFAFNGLKETKIKGPKIYTAKFLLATTTV